MNDDERRDGMLSEYLDGDLDARDAARVEARLEAEPALRALLEELRAVKRAAAEQPPLRAPELWSGIRTRIERERRRLAFTLPQLAAAAGIVLLLGVSLGRLSGPDGPGEPGTSVAVSGPTATAPDATTGSAVRFAEHVADLEARLEAGREVLDPATAQVIEQSLAKIDEAIDQAITALENDPNNRYLNQHLASSRARKLRLLEDATTLIASRT